MPKKKTKVKKKRARKSEKRIIKGASSPVSALKHLGTFNQSFRPAITARAVRPGSQRKMNLIFGNLIVLIILFAFSAVLYIASTTDFYKTLFFLLSMVFGGLSLAFLIAVLALVFLKILKK